MCMQLGTCARGVYLPGCVYVGRREYLDVYPRARVCLGVTLHVCVWRGASGCGCLAVRWCVHPPAYESVCLGHVYPQRCTEQSGGGYPAASMSVCAGERAPRCAPACARERVRGAACLRVPGRPRARVPAAARPAGAPGAGAAASPPVAPSPPPAPPRSRTSRRR